MPFLPESLTKHEWAEKHPSPSLLSLLSQRDAWLQRKDAPRFIRAFELTAELPKGQLDWEDPFVVVKGETLSAKQRQNLEEAAQIFIPWRKGPFRLFSLEIDAEWRSDLKWNRFATPDLFQDKNVLDIGCNNGYYMFRAAQFSPRWVLGIDPMHRLKFLYEWLASFVPPLPMDMEMLGVQELPLLPPVFDTILLMGIVYHHRDPVGILKNCKALLRPGGTIIVESLGIPGDEPVALFPRDRYTNMRNVYFIPTVTTLQNWLHRAGFSKIKTLYNAPLDFSEQRRTQWAPVESLKEFTSASDPSLTIEGYPSQHRMIIKGSS